MRFPLLVCSYLDGNIRFEKAWNQSCAHFIVRAYVIHVLLAGDTLLSVEGKLCFKIHTLTCTSMRATWIGDRGKGGGAYRVQNSLCDIFFCKFFCGYIFIHLILITTLIFLESPASLEIQSFRTVRSVLPPAVRSTEWCQHRNLQLAGHAV